MVAFKTIILFSVLYLAHLVFISFSLLLQPSFEQNISENIVFKRLRERNTERALPFTSSLAQMPTIAKVGPGQNLEPGTQYRYLTWVVGTQLFDPLLATSKGHIKQESRFKNGVGTEIQILQKGEMSIPSGILTVMPSSSESNIFFMLQSTSYANYASPCINSTTSISFQMDIFMYLHIYLKLRERERETASIC